jgi:adenylosuccinate synthase
VIALTKLDVLSGFDELQICAEYEIDGRRHTKFPNSPAMLERAKPIYRSLPGWHEDISPCRSFGELPREAREYVAFIERAVSVQVGLIGVGPGREDTILKDF